MMSLLNFPLCYHSRAHIYLFLDRGAPAMTLTILLKWFRICEKGPNRLGNIGEKGKLYLQPENHIPRTHDKLYIFENKTMSSFQKCIVSHGYCLDIQVAVIYIYPIFPAAVGPFSLIRNQIWMFIQEQLLFTAGGVVQKQLIN